MESKMGPGSFVTRAEQGQARAGPRPLQIGPIGCIPAELQAQGDIEGLGPLHVLHPQCHMAKVMNSSRNHGN